MSGSLRPHGLQHARLPCPSNSWSLLKLMSIGSVMPSNYLIFCRPLPLPSIFPNIMVFSSELVLCIGWPKYCSFSFSTSPSNEYSGLISFRIDCIDLLEVQGTLKSLMNIETVNSQGFCVNLSFQLICINNEEQLLDHTIRVCLAL